MSEGYKRTTVIEIENKKFAHRLRGYDPQAVRAFLQQVAVDYEETLRENQQMREELIALRDEVERYRALESTLKEALLLAQRSADETRNNAHREAELIVQEARRQAAEIEAEAHRKIEHLNAQIEALQTRRQALMIELRSLLQAHLQALEGGEEW